VLAALVRFSIRHRGFVVALAGLLLAYGGVRISGAGLDIFPEFSPKLVIVQTEAPGFSAEQVELLVTRPLEDALSGLIGLEYLRSESIQGLSIINVFFEERSDVYRNRQLVAERLAGSAARLPEGVGPAVPVPLASSSATILTIGLTSASKSQMELRDIADWVVVPRILSVRGVADVNVFGGEVRQLQIKLLPERLQQFGLSVDDVVQAARRASGILGTGFIEDGNQRLTLTVTGQPAVPEELERVVLARYGGGNVTLGDVARIGYGAAPAFGAATVMTEPAVVMMVIGQYGANTLTVSRAVESVLADVGRILSARDVVLHPDLFRPANYIETSLRNISGHLMVGGMFVVIVLFVFLYNLRTAFISALAIPLSLIAAALVLLECGVNLNIMVLGGLAIALGEVVDDAIIDTENIFRRLRENSALPSPKPVPQVVFDASMEVRGSVVYASFIVALVFVPLLTLGGVAGRLFAPLGFTYILAVLASLLVALTVTPALCYLMIGRGSLRLQDPPVIARLRPVYGRLLKRICAVPHAAILASLLLCAAGLAILPALGTKFLPELREGHYIVHTTSLPGTSLEESIRVGNRLTEAFLGIPGVRSVSQWAGRAERGADTFGSHYSEYEVDLEPMPGREQQRVLDEIRSVLRAFPGILYEANTFLIERVDETISGYTSPIVVNLYGDDLDLLDAQASRVAALMRDIDGATDVQVRSAHGTPDLRINLQLQKLAHYGLRPVEVMTALRTAFDGEIVGRVQEAGRVYTVAVILPPELRRAAEHVAALPLRTPDGGIIPLSDVAELEQAAGRYNILHQGGQRVQTVTANVQGRDLGSFLDELQSRARTEMEFESGTVPEFTGAAVEQRRARNELLLHSAVAGVIVLLLIYMAIGSLRHTGLVLFNLPFALVGGVFAVLATGGTLSVGSLVGFVTLFGITVRNSIMLVSHYRFLIEVERCRWNVETAVRGAAERLPSILMTALVTALAMLPIAFDSDNAGREIMGPMAAIIIGGLISSTILNLLIMPALMLRYGRFPVVRSTAAA
jgi:CzcA family heavy metal efflux pump